MSKGLILDGGGVFGVAQADILSKVTTLSKFDFIAGTSIGAVIGAIVASHDPVRIQALPAVFDTDMPNIFAGHWWRQYNPFTPRYNDVALNSVLKRLLPGFFKDVRVPLFITAADLNKRMLKVYFSGDVQDGMVPMWEVARQAVAAETYFKPWNGVADGGIFANNPCMVGIAGAQARLGMQSETVELCSIGTGEKCYNGSIGTTNGWTLLSWGGYLLRSLLDGSASKMHEYFASQMGLKRYERIQFLREEHWDMDDPAMVQTARDAWQSAIIAGTQQVEQF